MGYMSGKVLKYDAKAVEGLNRDQGRQIQNVIQTHKQVQAKVMRCTNNNIKGKIQSSTNRNQIKKL